MVKPGAIPDPRDRPMVFDEMPIKHFTDLGGSLKRNEDLPDPFSFKTDNHGDPFQYQNKAISLVVEKYNRDIRDVRYEDLITKDEVFVVWFSKTLQNWKALVSTDRSDGRYYELTYNGDRLETYVDVYTKVSNETISDIDR